MNEQSEATDPIELATSIIHIWALTLQLPMRRLVGKNMLGKGAAYGFGLTFFYGGVFAAFPVWWWCIVLFVALVCHRIATLSRRFRDTETHSWYNGFPLTSYLFFHRIGETALKAIVEPVIAIAIGVLVSPYGDAAAFYFLIGALCMVASTLLVDMRLRQQADERRDAMMESQAMRFNPRKRRW